MEACRLAADVLQSVQDVSGIARVRNLCHFLCKTGGGNAREFVRILTYRSLNIRLEDKACGDRIFHSPHHAYRILDEGGCQRQNRPDALALEIHERMIEVQQGSW